MGDPDPQLVKKVVDEVKNQGLFDQLRRDCLVNVEKKQTYKMLTDNVHDFCKRFLARYRWNTHMNKTQIRDDLREELLSTDFVKIDVQNIVNWVADHNKMKAELGTPVENIVRRYFSMPLKDDKASASSSQKEENDLYHSTRKRNAEHSFTATSNGYSPQSNPAKRSRCDQISVDTSRAATYQNSDTPVQDELFLPVDPTQTGESELSVHWHVTQLSPNPSNEANTQLKHHRFSFAPDEVESPAHERLEPAN